MEISSPIDFIILFFTFLIHWWWLILPFVLFLTLWEMWLSYVRGTYLSKMSWSMIEISVPKEVFQTPKAIENIFSTLHSISSAPEWWDIVWKGKIQDYISLEMVGEAGRSHIYIRMPNSLRGYITSQIYAQYPKAEIREAQDYISSVPTTAPDNQYDLWGTELILTKEDGYPIKTYIQFEETVEEKRIDPVSSILESFAQLQDGEQIWIQILIKPAKEDWAKKGRELIDKLLGKKITPKKTWLDKLVELLILPIDMFFGIESKPASKDVAATLQSFTPGQKEVIESIEKNISKLGFDTAIRTIYIAKRDIYNRTNIAAILGFFKQFNTLNLNGFKPNNDVTPAKVKYYVFKKQREHIRKKKVFGNYKLRAPGKSNFVFNTEELATIFHFPSTIVEAPSTPRIESKTAEPPINLPI